MKHTPGPWGYNKGIIYSKTYSMEKGWQKHLTIAKAAAGSADNWEANARLMAAAPDLLRAAELMLIVVNPDNVEIIKKKLLAAVEKARGNVCSLE